MTFTQVTPTQVKTLLSNGTTVYYLNPDKEVVSNLMFWTQKNILTVLADTNAVFFTATSPAVSDPLTLADPLMRSEPLRGWGKAPENTVTGV